MSKFRIFSIINVIPACKVRKVGDTIAKRSVIYEKNDHSN